MAKLKGPLFSLSARGWLGKYVYARVGLVPNPYPIALLPYGLWISAYYNVKGWVYQRCRTWHGIQWRAIRPPISAQPKTALQEAWKVIFAEAVTAWQGMSAATKDIYHHQSYPRKASGYNRFIRQYLNDNYPPDITVGDVLLQEDGDELLQQIGDAILLEKNLILIEAGDKLLQETGDDLVLGS